MDIYTKYYIADHEETEFENFIDVGPMFSLQVLNGQTQTSKQIS